MFFEYIGLTKITEQGDSAYLSNILLIKRLFLSYFTKVKKG